IFETTSTADFRRCTVRVYVFVVVPSEAVTTTVIVVLPTANGMAAEALPEATVVPFTLMVAALLFAVGVIVMLETGFCTVAVELIVPDAKAGVSVPLLVVKLDSVASWGSD